MLANNSSINAGSDNFGNAGNITIYATDTIWLSNSSNISAETWNKNSGKTGDIKLNTQHLILENKARIANLERGIGNSGSIYITTDTAKITGWSDITAEAKQARGGNIYFEVRDKLGLFDDSRIIAKARGENTQDSGGNITITNPAIFTLENSQLLANAYAGNGGKIDINASQFNLDNSSRIDVSSALGLNGEFILNSTKLRDEFLVLRPPTLMETELSLSRCAGLSREDLSSFFVIIRDVPCHQKPPGICKPISIFPKTKSRNENDKSTTVLKRAVVRYFFFYQPKPND